MPDHELDPSGPGGDPHVALTVTRFAEARLRGALLFLAAEIDGRAKFLAGFMSSTLLVGDGIVVEIARWSSRASFIAARMTPAVAEQRAILGDYAATEETVLGAAATWPAMLSAGGSAAVRVTLRDGIGGGGPDDTALLIVDPNRERTALVRTDASDGPPAVPDQAGQGAGTYGPLTVFATFDPPAADEQPIAYVLAPDPGQPDAL